MATQPNNTITLKELYERVVTLEAKFDLAIETGMKNTRFFKFIIFFVFFVEVINFFLNLAIIFKWR